MLADRGILYAPDYVVNAGGVIQVADEIAGFNFERAKARAAGIFDHHQEDLRAGGRGGRSARGGGGPAGRAENGRSGPAARHLAGPVRPLPVPGSLTRVSAVSLAVAKPPPRGRPRQGSARGAKQVRL